MGGNWAKSPLYFFREDVKRTRETTFSPLNCAAFAASLRHREDAGDALHVVDTDLVRVTDNQNIRPTGSIGDSKAQHHAALVWAKGIFLNPTLCRTLVYRNKSPRHPNTTFTFDAGSARHEYLSVRRLTRPSTECPVNVVSICLCGNKSHIWFVI